MSDKMYKIITCDRCGFELRIPEKEADKMTSRLPDDWGFTYGEPHGSDLCPKCFEEYKIRVNKFMKEVKEMQVLRITEEEFDTMLAKVLVGQTTKTCDNCGTKTKMCYFCDSGRNMWTPQTEGSEQMVFEWNDDYCKLILREDFNTEPYEVIDIVDLLEAWEFYKTNKNRNIDKGVVNESQSIYKRRQSQINWT